MKIAYLFHGHSRTWNHCYQSFFDNVYSLAPGDIYIHTWNRANSRFGSHWNNWTPLNEEHERLSSQQIDLLGIKNTYNPKDIIVEEDPGLVSALKKYPNLVHINSTPAHVGVYNMFESQKKVFELSEKYGEYDRYFSTRLDIEFKNKLNIVDLDYDNLLMVPPTFEDGTFDHPDMTMVFDIYAFASRNIMKTRSQFCDHIWDYWYSKNNLSGYWVEHAVTQYYRDNGIKAKPTNLNFDIKRLF